MTGGRIDGNEITFTHESCTWTGTWTGTGSGSPPDRIEGDVRCAIPVLEAEPNRLEGRWRFRKVGPLSNAPDLSGAWLLVASMTTSAFAGGTCLVDGDLQLEQAGSTLTGQVSNSLVFCGLPFADGDLDGGLTGVVNLTDHKSVRLSDGLCEWLGVIGGNPPDGVTGEVSCPMEASGEDTVMVMTGPFRLRSEGSVGPGQ